MPPGAGLPCCSQSLYGHRDSVPIGTRPSREQPAPATCRSLDSFRNERTICARRLKTALRARGRSPVPCRFDPYMTASKQGQNSGQGSRTRQPWTSFADPKTRQHWIPAQVPRSRRASHCSFSRSGHICRTRQLRQDQTDIARNLTNTREIPNNRINFFVNIPWITCAPRCLVERRTEYPVHNSLHAHRPELMPTIRSGRLPESACPPRR